MIFLHNIFIVLQSKHSSKNEYTTILNLYTLAAFTRG